jgi:phage tail-like protein
MVLTPPTNALFAAAMERSGRRLDPYMGYNFVIEIGGLLTGGFSNVSGLESNIQFEEYQEGGVNGYVHKFPTQVTYPNLVLTHGITDLNVLWHWFNAVAAGVILRLNGTVMMLDSDRLPIMWWNFKNAYPVRWVGPQLDASNSHTVVVEQLELVHQGITKPTLSLALSAARLVKQSKSATSLKVER